MHQVDLYRPQDPQAEYCLTDRGRRDLLFNLEVYRAALEGCRQVISNYNREVKP